MALIYCEKWLIWIEGEKVKALSENKNMRLKIKMDNNSSIIHNVFLMKKWIDELESTAKKLSKSRR